MLAALPLRYLSLASNAFSGALSLRALTGGRRRHLSAAAGFAQLTTLSLASNALRGTLLSSLFLLTTLVYLDLGNNSMR